jgi:hypothetical protein
MIAGDNEAGHQRCPGSWALPTSSAGKSAHRTTGSYRLAAAVGTAQNNLRDDPGLHPDTGLPTRQHVDIAGDAGPVAQALRHEYRQASWSWASIASTRCARSTATKWSRNCRRRFVSMLAQKVRKEDSLGHYSDSELAVVSPGTPYPACEAFAGRLREAFAVANIAYTGIASICRSVLASPIRRSIGSASASVAAQPRW